MSTVGAARAPVKRLAKESIVTACQPLGLTFCQTEDFIDWLREQAT